MEVVQLSDPVEFLERAAPLLLADEARHNLILGSPTLKQDLRHLGYERVCDSLQISFHPV